MIDTTTGPAADAEEAARVVVQWVAATSSALTNDKLTPTERARLGELALSAATWLAEREARIVAAKRDAKRAAFRESLNHLSLGERTARMVASA